MLLHFFYFLLGEIIEDDFNVDNESCCTKYKLTGIVVHSGQASGGHYYSYILHRLVSIISGCFYFNLTEKIYFLKISMLILCIPLAYSIETICKFPNKIKVQKFWFIIHVTVKK